MRKNDKLLDCKYICFDVKIRKQIAIMNLIIEIKSNDEEQTNQKRREKKSRINK